MEEQKDDIRSLLIPPRWIEVVLDTIERLEERAEKGEKFAKLALPAWYRELQRLERGDYV